MTFSIGRVGLPTASGGDGIQMGEPSDWNVSGDMVQLRGVHQASTEADLAHWVDQMAGLTDPAAERVVPVSSTVNTRFNGYYEVTESSAVALPGSLGGTGTRQGEWSVTLRRVSAWRNTRLELVTTWGDLSDSHGVSGTLLQAISPSSIEWTTNFPAAATHGTRAQGDSGSAINIAYRAAPGTSGSYVGRYLADADYHYLGACRAEYDVSEGGTPAYRHIVGAKAYGYPQVLDYLRVSNGMVRWTLSGGSGNIACQWYDGSVWESLTSFNLYHMGVSGNWEAHRAHIMVNRPEVVTIRYYGKLSYGGASLGDGSFPVDLTIRRGMRAVIIRTGRAAQWRLKFASVTACTSLTGGIRATSNDAGGNRPVITGSDATTFDTTNGYVSQTGAGATFKGAITCEIGGSGATGQNTAQNQLNETYIIVSEVQRAVAY